MIQIGVIQTTGASDITINGGSSVENLAVDAGITDLTTDVLTVASGTSFGEVEKLDVDVGGRHEH